LGGEGFCGSGVFNFFDAALCDGAGGAFALTDFFADAASFGPGFVLAFWVLGVDWARAFRAAVLGDFLRVFLDIRLPFVAFGGSIIAMLRVPRRSCPCWANLPCPEYGYNEFRATSRPDFRRNHAWAG
jgi:hypothetical protein